MRDPVEIKKNSAIYIAKWYVGERVKKETDFFRKMAMTTAIQDGGAIEQIADLLYDLGIKLSIDKSNPEREQWIKDGIAEVEIE